MQAALRDLTPNRNINPRPFLICQRVLHCCHQIIFGDPPEPSKSPYRSLPHSPASSTVSLNGSKPRLPILSGDRIQSSPARVKPHVQAAFVGMGTVVAAAPGMPALTELVGQWAVSQGRRAQDEQKETRDRVELDRTGGADGVLRRSKDLRRNTSEQVDSDEEDVPSPRPVQASVPRTSTPNLHFSPPSRSSPHFDLSHSPALSSSSRQKGDDPFSQDSPVEAPGRSLTPPADSSRQPSYSVPDFSTSQVHPAFRRLNHNDRPPNSDAMLATYSADSQRQLLRGHYCRSEIRFLLLLEDICNRLLVVPKPARVSALRAELTSLNHNLPADVSATVRELRLTIDMHTSLVQRRPFSRRPHRFP